MMLTARECVCSHEITEIEEKMSNCKHLILTVRQLVLQSTHNAKVSIGINYCKGSARGEK